MRTLYTIIFSVVFLVPCLFIMYGVLFIIIFLFMGISSEDYLRFFGIVFGVTGGLVGFFASVQLLGKVLDNKSNIMHPLWLKCFLTFGLASLIFIFANSPDYSQVTIIVLLLMPIPVVLYLMYLNRLYLWR